MIGLILSIIALTLICGKWIVFVFSIPIIRMYNYYRKHHNTHVDEIWSDEPNNDEISLKHRVKEIIGRYVVGYIWYMNIQVGQIPSHRIRNFIYKNIYEVNLAKKGIIYHGCEMRASYNLIVGKGAIIGDNAVLDARRGGILIGENVQIGSYVKMWTGSHDHDDPYFRSKPGKRGPIKIGNRAWIGPSVTILHSVNIGEGAVVCAGAVVTKDVAPFDIVGGIPAKKIGIRSQDLRYEFDGKPYYFY